MITDIVDKLLKHGASLDCKDCGESTPLFHAVYSSKQEVTKQLIKGELWLNCTSDFLTEL